MTRPDIDQSGRTRRSSRRVGVAVAVVALLAGACGDDSASDDPAAAADTPTDPDVTGDTQEAEGIAQDFVEASDAWDAETVRLLVADDAVIDGAVAIADDYLAVAEFERATGRRYTEPECTATVVGPPTEVSCTYTMANAWSQALGVGPFTGSSFDITIADGQIQQVTSNFNTSGFSWQVWDVFTAWLRDTHPDDVDVMFERVGDNDVPLRTPEAIALWAQHTTEFVASQSNS